MKYLYFILLKISQKSHFFFQFSVLFDLFLQSGLHLFFEAIGIEYFPFFLDFPQFFLVLCFVSFCEVKFGVRTSFRIFVVFLRDCGWVNFLFKGKFHLFDSLIKILIDKLDFDRNFALRVLFRLDGAIVVDSLGLRSLHEFILFMCLTYLFIKIIAQNRLIEKKPISSYKNDTRLFSNFLTL